MADGGNVKCHQCKKDMFVQCIASCGEQYPPCVVVENYHSTQQLNVAITLLNDMVKVWNVHGVIHKDSWYYERASAVIAQQATV